MAKNFLLRGSVIVIFLFSICNKSYSDSISWNIGNNFLNNIYKINNAELVYTDNHPSFYKIKKSSITDFEDVDLYLKFDRNTKNNIDYNYKYLYSDYTFKDKDAFIGNSALFFKNSHKLELEGDKNSIFTPGKIIDSFNISFWIYPLKLSTDEVVFRIGAHYYNEASNNVENQSISAIINEGVFNLKFNNVLFYKDLKHPKDMNLTSYERIVPGKWSNVIISYDAVEGQVRVLINGVENVIVMTTEDGTRYSSPLGLYYNNKNRCVISVAPSFVGSIDEFVIKRGSDINVLDKYSSEGAEIISDVYRLDDYPVLMKDIRFDQDVGFESTDIKYFIKFSENSFYRDNENVIKGVEWVELTSNLIKNVRAEYFQWKALLLPGEKGNSSPILRGITLDYDKDYPPAKPLGVRVISENGKIKIKWNDNTERDLKGYKIYYGTKSGHYFSKDALQGESPLKIGKQNQYEITGVKSNIIYYIAITSYDDKYGMHESDFSEEVFIRAK